MQCSPSLDRSVHGVLTGAQVSARVLHAGVSEARVLLGFESEARQAGVTSVPVDIGRRGRRVRTRRRWHSGVERWVAEVIQVVEAVEARTGDPCDRRWDHAGRHGGDGVGRGEHGLGGERVDVHGVEEGKAFSG